MKILAISGSLRAASHNTALLRAAAELAPEGVEVELYQGLELLPPFNEDWEREPPSEAVRLREAIEDAAGEVGFLRCWQLRDQEREEGRQLFPGHIGIGQNRC